MHGQLIAYRNKISSTSAEAWHHWNLLPEIIYKGIGNKPTYHVLTRAIRTESLYVHQTHKHCEHFFCTSSATVASYPAAYLSALYSEYVSPGLEQLDTSVTVHHSGFD